MSKERVFYLDFIRAFSTILIVLTHYNALFIYNVNCPSAAVLTFNIGNVYIGALGVSLFLIISGAALTYVYGSHEKVDWKKFYYKRFITIYPMFWIAYLLVGSLAFLEQKGINPFIPRKNFIFSILGFDTYVANFGVKTFCHVGEWFLGLIILIYIAFPLILKSIKRFPIIFAILIFIVYISSLIIFKDKSWCGIFFTVRIPEFIFGMYFIKYRKKITWYMALGSLAIIIINHILKPVIINQNIQVTYIGICAFVFLTYIAKFMKLNIIEKICATVCRYSYACFIIHHWIIYKVALSFNLNNITKFNSYILFFVCCVAVAFSSYFLFILNDKIIKYFKPSFK